MKAILRLSGNKDESDFSLIFSDNYINESNFRGKKMNQNYSIEKMKADVAKIKGSFHNESEAEDLILKLITVGHGIDSEDMIALFEVFNPLKGRSDYPQFEDKRVNATSFLIGD